MGSPLDRSSTPIQNPYTDPSMVESDADKSFSQSTLQQTSQKRLTSNDATIMQREREITDIAKGIIELADIFKDLQAMVIDQGTMLDRIDYNVERMTVDVKAADKELVVVCILMASFCLGISLMLIRNAQATGYQRKTTKRKILLLLLLLVIGMFILLLVKPKRQKAAPPKVPRPDSAPAVQILTRSNQDFLDSIMHRRIAVDDPALLVSGSNFGRKKWRRRRRRRRRRVKEDEDGD